MVRLGAPSPEREVPSQKERTQSPGGGTSRAYIFIIIVQRMQLIKTQKRRTIRQYTCTIKRILECGLMPNVTAAL